MNLTSGTFTSQQLQDALDRAEIWINNKTDTVFVDGTLATPSYTQVTNEKHRGKGSFNRDYFPFKYPLPNVSTTADGAITAADATITVVSTAGFPSTGIIGIETDKIAYTGKDATTFTGCTGVASDHLTAVAVKPYTIEISATIAGSDPTWNILNEGTEFDVDILSGRFYIYRDDYILDVYNSNNPQKIPNRVRLCYIAGNDTIPLDIEKLCLMVASKDLMASAVRKATVNGMNEFTPSLLNIDDAMIEETLKRYNSVEMSNT